VAQSEFATLVRSKAFIISIILMPIIMAVSVLLVRATRDSGDGRARHFAYVDYSGVIGPSLEAAASAWNEAAAATPGTTPTFFPVAVPHAGRSVDDLRLDLSARVRREELFAFVELPAELLDADAPADVRYYSDHPSYSALPEFLETSVNQIVMTERFRAASIDHALITRLTRLAPVNSLGLFDRDSRGGVTPAEKVDEMRAFAVPSMLIVLMYITVMTSAPQLLNSVIEEKMSRISEVLIASVSPFQLMLGKLLGSVSVALLLSFIYIGGAVAVANYWGYAGLLTPALAAYFGLFLVMAVLIFGSIFIAIGSACTDLKDSQSMMTPVMVIVMLPMMTWSAVLRAPDGTLAFVLSMVPTAAPFLMLVRISLRPGPPLWQILLSIGLMVAATLAVVWCAGRIFRTGLLMQGKSATVGEMIRWVRAG
ncbi:MAG: ABC transporter permease, partial [Vicinamibacterales bacterium]